ncbi:glutaredoxin-like protein NrdH [Xylocopilactobacillus apis]|nr:glutaredoxin-like protein NrdH [Xylocopilactobacillus apis]
MIKKQITVFSRNNCMQCKMVKRFLIDHGVSFNEINIDEEPSAREALINEGYMSLPVVKSNEVTFTGFRPDELRKIVA